MAFLKWPNKDPEEILDYPVDFSDWLVAGAKIDNTPALDVSLDGTSTPSGLSDIVISQIQLNSTGKQVITWLSGGTDGETYQFKITATDDQTPQRTVVRRTKITLKLK